MAGSAALEAFEQDEQAEAALENLLDKAIVLGESKVWNGSRPSNGKLINGLRDFLIREIKELVVLVLQAVEHVPAHWARLQQEGWAGHAAEVHAERASLARSVESKLNLLAHAQRAAALFPLLAGNALPEETRLPEAHNQISAIKTGVLDRWTTLEDLEDLLAQSFHFRRKGSKAWPRHIRRRWHGIGKTESHSKGSAPVSHACRGLPDVEKST
jgi:hypothetical protein